MPLPGRSAPVRPRDQQASSPCWACLPDKGVRAIEEALSRWRPESFNARPCAGRRSSPIWGCPTPVSRR